MEKVQIQNEIRKAKPVRPFSVQDMLSTTFYGKTEVAYRDVRNALNGMVDSGELERSIHNVEGASLTIYFPAAYLEQQ